MANEQIEYQGYRPPFSLSAKAVGLVADIAAQMERFAIRMEQDDALRLRKANRIKTIHSSLAIEGNTLLESEVADIIDGKTVENMVYSNQQAYYDAIAQSTKQGESGPFIEFMLEEILDTVRRHQGEPIIKEENVGANVGVNVGVNEQKVLALIMENGHVTAKQMADEMGISQRQVERLLASLTKKQIIVREGADKNGYWKLNK